MEKLTKTAGDSNFIISSALNTTEDGFCGEAADQLAQFEQILDYLIRSQTEIPQQLDALRKEGKEKTVKFRELMAQKLANTNTMLLLKRFGVSCF